MVVGDVARVKKNREEICYSSFVSNNLFLVYYFLLKKEKEKYTKNN